MNLEMIAGQPQAVRLEGRNESMENTRIFSRRLEKIFQIVVIFFAILMCGEIFGLFPWLSASTSLMDLLVGFIFLNSVHTIFTAIMLFSFPEFQAWLKATLSSPKAISLFLALSVIVYAAVVQMSQLSAWQVTLVFGTVVALKGIHNVAQFKGLSLLYNELHSAILSPAQKLKQKQVETVERRLLSTFVFNVFLCIGLIKLNLSYGSHLKWTMLGFLLFHFSLIFLNALRYPQIRASNKLFYLLSGVFFPLGMAFPLAVLMQRALHGIEYGFLFAGLVKQSSLQKTLFWGLTTSAIILGWVFLLLTAKGWGPQDWATRYSGPLLAIGFIVEFSHYYLDGLIFKFSDPVVALHLKALHVPRASQA
jgi:hypothetical protein